MDAALLACVLFIVLMFNLVAGKLDVAATMIGDASPSILVMVAFCVTAVNLPFAVGTVGRLVLPILLTNFMYCTYEFRNVFFISSGKKAT